MMTITVNSWWTFLCTVAAINIVVWIAAAKLLYQRKDQGHFDEDIYVVRRWQLILSAIYVSGCAFRSFFPVFDVPRIVMYDSWLSSVIVGRSVATIAELSFVAQWALMLREVSRTTESSFARVVSQALVPMIVVAEVFSWSSVLTTANIGHTVEETLWGISAALLVISLIVVGPRCSREQRRMLNLICITGIAYVAYMFLVDVPMYWSRWLADEAANRSYMTFAQGLHDTSTRWAVSHHWDDWKNEVVWMSIYFSVAVWLSIALVHAPHKKTQRIQPSTKRLTVMAQDG